MTKMNGRNHNVTLGVAFIISCVIMLLFLLNKTHEKLEDSKTTFVELEDKYSSLVKQFESLYEYKQRLENSFKNFQEKKSSAISDADSLKSELAVLKSSHKNEIQRLHDELDACRRREEVAGIHRAQKDEAFSPSSLAAHPPSVPISPVEDVHSSSKDTGIKVISSLKSIYQQSITKEHSDKLLALQPSMDPNQDLAGNIMV